MKQSKSDLQCSYLLGTPTRLTRVSSPAGNTSTREFVDSIWTTSIILTRNTCTLIDLCTYTNHINNFCRWCSSDKKSILKKVNDITDDCVIICNRLGPGYCLTLVTFYFVLLLARLTAFASDSRITAVTVTCVFINEVVAGTIPARTASAFINV